MMNCVDGLKGKHIYHVYQKGGMHMDIDFKDFVSLVQAIAWPIVLVVVVMIFRRQIPKLVEALGGKISSLSVIGVTIEFTAVEPTTETLSILNDIREPSPTGPPPSSAILILLDMVKKSPQADFLVIDLRDGQAWLTSRLYLFALVLAPALGLRSFLFVGNKGLVPRYFLGLTPPNSIVLSLEKHYPWLRQVMVETQLELQRCYDPNPETKEAIKRLFSPSSSSTGEWDAGKADALSKIVHQLVDPLNLYERGNNVDTFVRRFFENTNIRRPKSALDKDWINLGEFDEHARWIKDEQGLLDLMGDALRRENVVDNSGTEQGFFEKAVLQKQGDFVAVIDPEGRFERLIDRSALVARIIIEKLK